MALAEYLYSQLLKSFLTGTASEGCLMSSCYGHSMSDMEIKAMRSVKVTNHSVMEVLFN